MDTQKWTAYATLDRLTTRQGHEYYSWSLTIRRNATFFAGASGSAPDLETAYRAAFDHAIERIHLVDDAFIPPMYAGVPEIQRVTLI